MEKNDTKIERVLDDTTTDLHVGRSAAESQGHLQFTYGHSLLHNNIV